MSTTEGANKEESIAALLLSVKKKLKQWERMYEKEHGHKPTKNDITDSSIKELYKKYNDLRRLTTLSTNSQDNCTTEVFGESFNKKKMIPVKRPRPLTSDCTKARKWFKGIGYKTVSKEKQSKEDTPLVVQATPLVSVIPSLLTTAGDISVPTSSLTIKDISNKRTENNMTSDGYILPIHKPVLKTRRLSEDWLAHIKTAIDREQSVSNYKCVESSRIPVPTNDSCFHWLEGSQTSTMSTSLHKEFEIKSPKAYPQEIVQSNKYPKEPSKFLEEPFNYSEEPSINLPSRYLIETNEYHSTKSLYQYSEKPSNKHSNEPVVIKPPADSLTNIHSNSMLYKKGMIDTTTSSLVDLLDTIDDEEDNDTDSDYEMDNERVTIVHDKEEETTSGFRDDRDMVHKEEQLTFKDEEYAKNVSKKEEKSSVNSANIKLAKSNRTVSDNFVRLNMKVKHFSRKSVRLTGPQYKRQQWKKRQQAKGEWKQYKKGGGGGGECFKCGKSGHWARNCTMNDDNNKVLIMDTTSSSLNDKNAFHDNSSPFPSIDDISQKTVCTTKSDCPSIDPDPSKVINREIKNGDTNKNGMTIVHKFQVDPYFKTTTEVSDTVLIKVLKQFGYRDFKPGQRKAIVQILSGQSTLLVQPTGAGKSLCYQLPAHLYSQCSLCFTLVISPLISLMEDQVKNLPSGLTGASLHVGLSTNERKQILTDLEKGLINILFVSPETLASGSKEGNFLMSHQLPPIAFACIDEVHCLSEWSHNFRPSYLRTHKVLRDQLGIQCILGLTATATQSTVKNISQLLDIKSDSVIVGSSLPDNLEISVSCVTNREQALIDLLTSFPFKDCQSMIIYCTRQQTTERIAQLIRTSLQYTEIEEGVVASGKGKGAKKSHIQCQADCYHAGLMPKKRKQIQNNFMKGKLRIVVATVAFGMGLNKADVRGIIHYNIPHSFESFVQEIGRAGRDGLKAYCHVFVDNSGSDLLELRRHIYANGVDYFHVKSLCQKLFLPLPFNEEGNYRPREVAVPINQLSQSLDTKEETLSTLLCYLEQEGYIEVLNPINDTITVKCYEKDGGLLGLAKTVPLIDAALKQVNQSQTTRNFISFSLTDVAYSLQCDTTVVLSQLQSAANSMSSSSSKDGLIIESSKLSFHVLLAKPVSDEDKDVICQKLLFKVRNKESYDLERLINLYSILKHVSTTTTHSSSDTLRNAFNVHFTQGLTAEYFTKHNIPITTTGAIEETTKANLCRDICSFLSIYDEQHFTGRAIARIFQGIGSPQYPSEVWGQCSYWRKYLDVDFNTLCSIATQQIVS